MPLTYGEAEFLERLSYPIPLNKIPGGWVDKQVRVNAKLSGRLWVTKKCILNSIKNKIRITPQF